MNRNLLFLVLVFLFQSKSNAEDSIAKSPTFTFSAYLEAYYAYDFSKPLDNTRPNFLYSHTRHNEPNLNLAFAKVNFNKNRVRANLGLMYGTYQIANLAGEPAYLRNIMEANIGFKISKKNNWWIDVGVLPSHIGFESAISRDCWTLTRSILAENTPYFETGIRLGYIDKKEKLSFNFLVLNGWQKIQWIKGNSMPSYGAQLGYKFTEKLNFNASYFLGTNDINANRRWRFYQNLYLVYQPHKKLGFTAGLDLGLQQVANHQTAVNPCGSGVLIVRYQPINKLAIAARYEYYRDDFNVIIQLPSATNISIHGFSLNLDYQVIKQILWRIEGRYFQGGSTLFGEINSLKKSNAAITTSLAFSF